MEQQLRDQFNQIIHNVKAWRRLKQDKELNASIMDLCMLTSKLIARNSHFYDSPLYPSVRYYFKKAGLNFDEYY